MTDEDVEVVAESLAHIDYCSLQTKCGYEVGLGECDDDTCPARWYDDQGGDHNAEWVRKGYRDRARAAIAAMQPILDRLERQRDAALDALKVARNAVNKAANQFEFYAENHYRKNTKDGNFKAEVNRNLGSEMRRALAQIDAMEGKGR